MAVVSGSANDMTGLRQGLFDACTANGWTLSGEVLHKGTVYIRVQVTGTTLTFLGGTGINGSNVLTGGHTVPASIRGSVTEPMTWPVSFDVHILDEPDEVYLIVKYNGDAYAWAAFGCSPFSGVTTGNWYAAIAGNFSPQLYRVAGGTQGTSGGILTGAMMWKGADNIANASAFLHKDGNWCSCGPTAVNNVATPEGWGSALNPTADGIYVRSPNKWNGESILVPIQVFQLNASNKVSLSLELGHARYFRIDNYEPDDVVQIGNDRWKILPWHRKDKVNRGGVNGNSGTFGWAIRYTGD